MTMTAKVFRNVRSKAIRLPKEYRVDSDEVYIEKIGHSLILVPKEKSKWDVIRNALEDLEDFDIQRNQLEIQTNLESKGEIIGSNDLFIAAHTKSLDAVLVTNNTREFKRVKGLKIEDWTK